MISKRELMGAGLATAAASTATSALAQAPVPAPASASPLSGGSASRIFAEAETANGRVRGFDVGGIKTFRGIPYGAPTGGRNRFMPPQPAAPWRGVRDCFAYGPISPQTLSDPRSEYAAAIGWDHHADAGMGEDCLVLNVWTPGLDGARRPVLVSFHGGGFSTGSGATFGFNGDPLARMGAVVVTVNHRLGALGYLHLGDLGGPPASGVAGVQDLVASLQWVRDNIARFGGDPNSVMIFGQSGGGAKTATVLGMPSAKGLFQRAAVQSGAALRAQSREDATRSAERLLRQLNVRRGDMRALQALPWSAILEAQAAVGVPAGGAPPADFRPVLDGVVLPRHPHDPDASPFSADVPVIVSTTLDDAGLRLTNYDLDAAGLERVVAGQVPSGQAQRVIAAYRRAYPDASPYLLQVRVLTDRSGRKNAIRLAERKAAQAAENGGRGKAYMYFWTYYAPAFHGKFGAIHGIDVSTAFNNVRPVLHGDTPDALTRLAQQHSAAWLAFARTGNPSTAQLPWPAYDARTRATMVFSERPHVENDPQAALRELWEAMPA